MGQEREERITIGDLIHKLSVLPSDWKVIIDRTEGLTRNPVVRQGICFKREQKCYELKLDKKIDSETIGCVIL